MDAFSQVTSLKEQRWQRTQKIWNELRADNLHILDDYYDAKVAFTDPLGHETGLELVKRYYVNLYENVKEIEFKFEDAIYDDDKQFFSWTMHLTTDALNSGEPIKVSGATLLRFSNESGKVIYHRDYFDTGEFIYENVWGLRWLHNYIKGKMRPKDH
jgi:hypothetical protein